MCDILYTANTPITPVAPFKPHDADFPSLTLKTSITMKNGFVVLDQSPEDITDEQVFYLT